MSAVFGVIIILAGILFIVFQVRGLVKDYKKRAERKKSSKVETEKEPIKQDSSSDKK